jgi:hypothetical protein
MLGRHDGIFWTAGAILLASLALAALVDNGFLLLMVVSYLLRPTLHSLGLFKKLIDERQLQIHYRASNVGFAAMVAGNIIVIVVLMGQRDQAWEMVVAVLLSALAIRALAGVLMVGDPLVAGVRILVATGSLLALFGIVEGGMSGGGVHVIPGLLIAAIGLAGRRWPRPVGLVVLVLVAAVVFAMTRSAMAGGHGRGWGEVEAMLLLTVPPVVAAICLLRGAPTETDAPGRLFAPLLLAAFGAASAGAQTPPLDCKPWGATAALGRMCTLAHDDTVKGHTLPAGTRLHYDTTGALDFFWITKPALFDGLELNGTGEGPHHLLYGSGSPRLLWLSRTQDVQGVPCRPISFWTEIIGRTSAVRFHPNGRLQECRLGRDATIQGRRFDRGERVAFDTAGVLAPAAP